VAAATVVAAVIERDGCILIGQRKRSSAHPLKWEFPGGKVDTGEAPPDALLRELEEELGVRARLGPEITRYEFQYPGRPPILLIFYRVSSFDGEPENRAFEKIAWDRPENLANYDFLEGDIDFIQTLGLLKL
jgi:8-oxo-dGTP diphosphatase